MKKIKVSSRSWLEAFYIGGWIFRCFGDQDAKIFCLGQMGQLDSRGNVEPFGSLK